VLLGSLALVAVRLGVAASPVAAAGGAYEVNSTGDLVDATPGNGVCLTAAGTCTLRAALTEDRLDAGATSITFDISGTGTRTITIASALPVINDTAGPTTIDGYTQSDAQPNTNSLVSNARIRVEIRGTGVTGPDALAITSAGNLIKGLALYDLRVPIRISGTGAADNVVVGNFIGTNAAGSFGHTVRDGAASGVFINQGAVRNLIGRAGAADRNVISGNGFNGVHLNRASDPVAATNDNKIQNNIIGLSPNGAALLRNLGHGIDINAGASFNVVGGTGAGQGNVLSGNFGVGAEVSHGGGGVTVGNQIVGNKIGTNPSGSAGPAYARNGEFIDIEGPNVSIEDRVIDTVIAGNVIGNNLDGGIKVNSGSQGTRIENNRIGISTTGVAIPNGLYGVQIEAGPTGGTGTGSTIGSIDTTVGPGNLITANETGVHIVDDDTLRNTVTRNSIFANEGLGIDLQPFGVNQNDAGDADTGANTKLNWPVLTGATPESVTGTACAGCRVEIFVADTTNTDGTDPGAYGEGRTLAGEGDADENGNFTIAVTGAAGKVVTATATDADGNTSEFSRNRAVPNVFASDNFNRSLISGWGNAQIGGAWTPDANPGSFSVNGQRGIINQPVGEGRAAELRSVSATRVDLSATVETSRRPSSGFHIVSLAARWQDVSTWYRARLRLNADGTVHAGVVANGGLIGEALVPGLTHTPGTPLRIRATFTGTNPTTIRVKVWEAGEAEPSGFAVTVTDSTASLQEPGAVGVSTASLESGLFSVAVSFDDLRAVSPK
jgi:hypothetical protein